MSWLLRSYKRILQYLSRRPEYNKDDFTVEYFPTLGLQTPTRVVAGRTVPDITLLAPDCFHFMKELHSRIGM